MMKKWAIASFGLILVLFFSFISCSQSYVGTGSSTGEVLTVDTLFVNNETTNVVSFVTNDSKYWSTTGYTLWSVSSGKDSTDFTNRTVSLSKVSGCSREGDGWYGIVFCHGVIIGYGTTMLTCMVNTQGQYQIGEVVGTDYTAFSTGSTDTLNKGIGVPNELNISHDSSSGIFTLTINNTQVTTFIDEEAPVHTQGNDGYIVVISPYDDFPDVPVSVKFQEVDSEADEE